MPERNRRQQEEEDLQRQAQGRRPAGAPHQFTFVDGLTNAPYPMSSDSDEETRLRQQQQQGRRSAIHHALHFVPGHHEGHHGGTRPPYPTSDSDNDSEATVAVPRHHRRLPPHARVPHQPFPGRAGDVGRGVTASPRAPTPEDHVGGNPHFVRRASESSGNGRDWDRRDEHMPPGDWTAGREVSPESQYDDWTTDREESPRSPGPAHHPQPSGNERPVVHTRERDPRSRSPAAQRPVARDRR